MSVPAPLLIQLLAAEAFGRQWVLIQIVGSLPPTGKTWVGFLDPGSSLVYLRSCGHVGSESGELKIFFCFALSLVLSSQSTNQSLKIKKIPNSKSEVQFLPNVYCFHSIKK